MVGIDQHACPALDGVAGVHQIRCNLLDLCEDDADNAKRGTTAARTLKSLLATLQPATTSAGVKLSLLVSNAAYQVVAPFSETTLKDFNEVLSTNLTAPFMLTKLLLPELTVWPMRMPSGAESRARGAPTGSRLSHTSLKRRMRCARHKAQGCGAPRAQSQQTAPAGQRTYRGAARRGCEGSLLCAGVLVRIPGLRESRTMKVQTKHSAAPRPSPWPASRTSQPQQRRSPARLCYQ